MHCAAAVPQVPVKILRVSVIVCARVEARVAVMLPRFGSPGSASRLKHGNDWNGRMWAGGGASCGRARALVCHTLTMAQKGRNKYEGRKGRGRRESIIDPARERAKLTESERERERERLSD